MSIVIFLLALLVPSLYRAKEGARRVQCTNNLKQWGFANRCYRDDNLDYFPTEGTNLDPEKPYTWYNELPPYLDAPPYRDVAESGRPIQEFPALHVWLCPSKNLSRLNKSESGRNQYHYAMNQVLDGMDSPETPDFPERPVGYKEYPILASQFKDQSRTVFMFDVFSNAPDGKQDDVATSFHRGIANVLFLDGSVAAFSATDFVANGDFVHGALIWNHPNLYWGYLPPRR